jgi:hypothetical protein
VRRRVTQYLIEVKAHSYAFAGTMPGTSQAHVQTPRMQQLPSRRTRLQPSMPPRSPPHLLPSRGVEVVVHRQHIARRIRVGHHGHQSFQNGANAAGQLHGRVQPVSQRQRCSHLLAAAGPSCRPGGGGRGSRIVTLHAPGIQQMRGSPRPESPACSAAGGGTGAPVP